MAEWHPWQEMETLRDRINNMFEESNRSREPFVRSSFLPGRSARRYPLIRLYEDKDVLYVEALAPGIDPNSLEVTVLRNVLTIAGEKRREAGEVKPEAFHRSERATGKFVRNIELPIEVDEHQVQADYQHGLLLVKLPKSEKAKPKQVSISVA